MEFQITNSNSFANKDLVRSFSSGEAKWLFTVIKPKLKFRTSQIECKVVLEKYKFEEEKGRKRRKSICSFCGDCGEGNIGGY